MTLCIPGIERVSGSYFDRQFCFDVAGQKHFCSVAAAVVLSSRAAELLEKDPAYRFGFEDIVKHPLMSDINFDDVLHKRVQPDYIPERFDPEDPLYKKIKSESCVFAHGVSYDSQQAGLDSEEVNICQLNRIYG